MRQLKLTEGLAGRTIKLGPLGLVFKNGTCDVDLTDGDFEKVLRFYGRSYKVVEGTYGSSNDQVHESQGSVSDGDGKVSTDGRSADEAADDSGTDAEADGGGEGVSSVGAGSERSHAADLVAALATLEKDNDEHWTEGGLPRVDVMAELCKRSVSRAELKETGITRE